MTKTIAKFFLQIYLNSLTRIALVKNRPLVIFIAGSLNKSFTKEAVADRLRAAGWNVRHSINNYNTEIGLPLSILNLPSGYNSYQDWWPTIKQAPKNAFNRDFPEILVLEAGISDPGDMKKLVSIAMPDITIITEINKRYLESFDDVKGIASEYSILMQKTKNTGLIVLNNDNELIRQLPKDTVARIETIGLVSPSDYSAVKKDGKSSAVFDGMEVPMVAVRPGLHHEYAELFSIAVMNFIGRKNEK